MYLNIMLELCTTEYSHACS